MKSLEEVVGAMKIDTMHRIDSQIQDAGYELPAEELERLDHLQWCIDDLYDAGFLTEYIRSHLITSLRNEAIVMLCEYVKEGR